MSKKLAIAMFGQKRLSREGGVEIVVKELCTRMAQNGCDVTCYNRAGHHVSGAEYDDATIEYAAVWVLNPMELNKKVGYGEYVPPISYDSLSGDLEGAFSNQDNDDNESQGKIIACHGVGCDLRMYVQQSDFTIHSTTERLDQILKLDESCDYFYKIRIPRKIRKKLLVQLDAMGFHESSIYPDMEHIAKEQTTSHFNF